MKNIENPWIKLKENINKEDYEVINRLQQECIDSDKVALKLELDYKLASSNESSKITNNTNEFMYFDGEKLIGYIGIGSFGGFNTPIEVNGMVHPDYRKQGVFKKLSELVIDEWKIRNSNNMFLLSDRTSKEGQEFIKNLGATYNHTEYEMYFRREGSSEPSKGQSNLTFRKANNEDAYELAKQDAIYFGEEVPEENDKEKMILPEEEEKKGIRTYLAEKDNEVIGKVRLELTDKGGIYGLGVLPKHRRKGYAREMLKFAVNTLIEDGAKEVMLQVDSENPNALNLYKSCGFVETSVMDYYEMKL
ncbi:GNAT family N-acetyltransferase [Clostridium intestinale]|uniref:Predicted acetyltransferase n=1 Tax=Clostridium intestinale DSM 6191 TaxID=1121320 RepID=A0A1M5Z2W0_9CLOT|nr:GNAT family N-acetyltransferase [Clostridium intestinale]SHI18587.1 Predicted acetyltransferase [Clostridium intestinale DSM 6191]